MGRLDSALWRDIMGYLRHKHAPICRQWFEELEPIGLDSGLLRVYTGSSVQQNYLQRKCLDQFTEAAQAVTGALVAVRFVNTEDEPNGYEKDLIAESGELANASTQAAGSNGSNGSNGSGDGRGLFPARSNTPRPYDQPLISPDYSFDNFVTGPENRLAHAASIAVSNQPGVAYNPLFIHGGVGLGKTHLLQATCSKILNDNPDAKICYLSCDAFITDYVDCVQKGTMADFRLRYRSADMLVIDDVHFLADRERTQEEFFHTFNELHQLKRQIVLSSDSPPDEIPSIEERLASRFKWGLVACVSRPSYETRLAIVKAKAELRGVQVPDDVMRYIATKIDSNARELEGAITTIQGHASLQNRAIDLELAHEALGDNNYDPRSAQVTLQNIIDVVTNYYSVKLSDLQSKRRHKSITLPRQVCMYLARKRTRFSLQEIGGYFGGRDHTTVMHSINTVGDRMDMDSQFSEQVNQLDERITSQPVA